MIYYKTPDEIELIRASAHLVCKTLAHVGSILRPGLFTWDLDRAAEEFILSHPGATPSFKGYRGYPASLCISVNEQVVHGIPSKDKIIEEGDVVSVDCGVFWNGFHGDAAYTFMVGQVSPEVYSLCEVTYQSLYLGIEQAVSGNRVGDIGFAIQEYVEKKYGYGIVRDLVGHGIGRQLHEKPEVANYGKRGSGMKLQEGLTIAIEPMVNLGSREVKTLRDGWTVVTRDKSPSAHYEHSVAVGKTRADILSDHSYIEAAVNQNKALTPLKISLAAF
ncbi:MAG: type I methionyl aminopeptidase [Haliscomenobacter sp.]